MSKVTLVQQYIVNSAREYPHRIAALFNDESITYLELDEYSNRLANTLAALGVSRGDRVSFCLFKSLNPIKALVGILKADAAYVPLDVASPLERMKKIIDDAKPAVLIADNETLEAGVALSEHASIPLVLLSPQSIIQKDKCTAETVFEEDVLRASEKERTSQNTPSDNAYIFYTSGSTGTPKGVMITHGNLTSMIEWAVPELGILSRDRISSIVPYHFDVSQLDIFCSFSTGATLCVVPERLSAFPGALLTYIEDKRMTILNSVPTLYTYIVRSGVLRPERLATVEKVFFNGEVFPPKYLAEWMKIFPHKEFINMYGPTEATVQCLFYRVPKPPTDFSKSVPIGKATANASVFVLTSEGRKVKKGETGELYISGPCVSPGYWNNPKKTKEVFVQNPLQSDRQEIVYRTGDHVRLNEDGLYEFIGRKDHQIKRSGYRIELGEIEAALLSLPDVTEAAVISVPHPTEEEKTNIVVYVVSRTSSDASAIQRGLSELLPAYMMPDEYQLSAALPKTSTGKKDRVTLKKEYDKRPRK